MFIAVVVSMLLDGVRDQAKLQGFGLSKYSTCIHTAIDIPTDRHIIGINITRVYTISQAMRPIVLLIIQWIKANAKHHCLWLQRQLQKTSRPVS